MSLTMGRRGVGSAGGGGPVVQNKVGHHHQTTQFLETVWSEPGSPVGEQPGHVVGSHKQPDKDLNLNDTKLHKRNNSTAAYYDEALEALLRGFQGLEGVDGGCGTPGDPDQLFLLPDRVLTVDSLTFREELAAVAPTFLSPVTPTAPPPGGGGGGFGKLNNNNNNNHPPHSSLDSTDSNRSVRLADDTEGLIITRACNGCLWLCECQFTSPILLKSVRRFDLTVVIKFDRLTKSGFM